MCVIAQSRQVDLELFTVKTLICIVLCVCSACVCHRAGIGHVSNTQEEDEEEEKEDPNAPRRSRRAAARAAGQAHLTAQDSAKETEDDNANGRKKVLVSGHFGPDIMPTPGQMLPPFHEKFCRG